MTTSTDNWQHEGLYTRFPAIFYDITGRDRRMPYFLGGKVGGTFWREIVPFIKEVSLWA